MRAGGCTVQQALTPEAASVVKQAVSLARRRGHAQVTPLHVANAMLSSSTGLLRAACLQSHSHPLQCKALELCFNVALNRLPASSSSSPILSHHHHHHHHQHHHPPSLSNALVAAFKRAQAHQRRGSIESQQQPLLAVKIELEQLIISILDDPSVSRVMREAGFSSTQVKSNVEQTISMEVSNPNASSTPSSNPKPSKPQESHSTSDQDVMYVIDSLVSKRRRGVVLVGECLESSEAVVRAVMDKVEKGDHIPESLGNLQFVILPLFSLGHMSREEVEHKIGELRCLVKSCYGGKGAVLYLGDLKWVAEYYNKGRGFYCPVEHMIMEIGRLLCGSSTSHEGDGVSQNFWLMGIASFQTYIKCRSGSPSLESLWALHPLTIPSGSLGLSLNYDNPQNQMVKTKRSGDGSSFWSLMDKGVGNQLNCCSSTDYSLKYDTDNHRKVSSSNGSVTTSLPSWLQQYKEEKKSRETSNDQDSLQVHQSSCKNWSSICSSSHKHHHQLSEMTLHFSSSSPSSSSISSHEHHYGFQQTDQPWLISAKHPWREHHLWLSESVNEGFESSSMKFSKETKGFGILKPNPLSTSSSDHTMEMDQCYPHKFRELNAENLKTLCNALEKKVSWHKDIIPDIVSTILRCRSGMMRRKERIKSTDTKEDTWLFFQGGDCEAKEKIARELANLVFGSSNNLVTISLNNYSSTTKSDSSDDLRNKRVRSEASHSYLERFFEAIKDNHHRVFLMEDLEQIDYCSQVGIKNAIERGRIRGPNGEEASVGDAILILSCENFDSRSRACSPPVKQKSESHEEDEKEDEGDNEVGSGIFLDLNLCADDEEADEDVVVVDDDDVGLLESVDRSFFFNLHEDHL
ncbi:protein SMAX1-LIKE 3-like isoform X2 [Dioscorea cayenensis subsp. rotundata]|uniref:Protein SMAX1-LIKE 3-like isoform X2 n=1 Tax=Dioscorea cayennensis subsp. rotundata TaxID=55577 RepID=A0AB40BGM7_DIOCR|nr:protein SMAX1-LIKE 3-like isoform X2 [Dioscorea cayenensis subsp. rotundata]